MPKPAGGGISVNLLYFIGEHKRYSAFPVEIIGKVTPVAVQMSAGATTKTHSCTPYDKKVSSPVWLSQSFDNLFFIPKRCCSSFATEGYLLFRATPICNTCTLRFQYSRQRECRWNLIRALFLGLPSRSAAASPACDAMPRQPRRGLLRHAVFSSASASFYDDYAYDPRNGPPVAARCRAAVRIGCGPASASPAPPLVNHELAHDRSARRRRPQRPFRDDGRPTGARA